MTQGLIAHMVSGTGDDVLLLNGGLMTMQSWEPIAQPLSKEYRVIRCDFRGQLMSPGTPPATLEEHLDDVIAVLDFLEVQRTHVIGTSFGGLVGLTMAAHRSERVRSLVAGTTTDYYPEQDWIASQPMVAASHAAAAGGDGGSVLDHLFPATFSDHYRAENHSLLEERRKSMATLPQHYFEGLSGILELLHGLDLRPLLSSIHTPTLVLAAGNDRIFPHEHSVALAAGIRDSRLETIPDAPHGVFLEQPEKVLEIVRAFIKGH